MKIRKILLMAGLGLMVATAPVFAEEEEEKENWLPGTLAGNVALYTDYSFRGLSQTGKNLALQGGIDWSHEMGFFVGTWGSSLNYAGNPVILEDPDTGEDVKTTSLTSGGYLEQDFYGGYTNTIGENFTYDTRAIFFFYPGDEKFNYWEFVLGGSYNFDFMLIKAGVVGSPDYFGTQDTGLYFSSGFAVPIPFDFRYFDVTFDANGGYTHVDRPLFLDHHWFDWNAGLVFALPFNLSLDFRVVGTDVKDVSFADDRFVFGAKYSF